MIANDIRQRENRHAEREREWDSRRQWHPERGDERPGSSGFGGASLGFAIAGMILIPFAILGFIFGLIGLSGNRSGKGMAAAGLAISIIGIIIWAIALYIYRV